MEMPGRERAGQAEPPLYSEFPITVIDIDMTGIHPVGRKLSSDLA